MNANAFNLRFEAFKRAFVNVSKVESAYDRAGKRALATIGAVQRRHARKKIKRRVVTANQWQRYAQVRRSGDKQRAARLLKTIEKKQTAVSKPGDPPFAHVPDHPVASIRAIYFSVLRSSVIVGAVKANQVTLVGGNRSTVPELLEFGGVQSITERSIDRGKTWRRVDQRRSRRRDKKWHKYRRRMARYSARPFMQPTLRETQAKTREIIRTTFARARAA